MPRVMQSWRKLISHGLPDLVAIRRPLDYGSVVVGVGESVIDVVPKLRLRPLYEARRIGVSQVQGSPAAPEKEQKKNGRK